MLTNPRNFSLSATDQPTTHYEEGRHPDPQQEDVQQVQEEQKVAGQHGRLLQEPDGEEQFLQPGRPFTAHDLIPALLTLGPHADHAHSDAPFLQLALCSPPPFQYGDRYGLGVRLLPTLTVTSASTTTPQPLTLNP